MVVHLLDAEVLLGVSQQGARGAVQVEVGLAAFAREPRFDARLQELEQLCRALRIALRFHDIQQLGDPLQALSLPVRPVANLQHHPPCIAQI